MVDTEEQLQAALKTAPITKENLRDQETFVSRIHDSASRTVTLRSTHAIIHVTQPPASLKLPISPLQKNLTPVNKTIFD